VQPARVDSFVRENRGSVLLARVESCSFLRRARVVAESGYVRVDLCDGLLDKCVNFMDRKFGRLSNFAPSLLARHFLTFLMMTSYAERFAGNDVTVTSLDCATS